jgi:predicted O-linked N-acetylglucosamine transferase (SPINDLY family)
LQRQGKLNEAVVCHRRAVALNPAFQEGFNNLATALKAQGKLDEALVCYRRALALRPDYAEAHSNLLLTGAYTSQVATAAGAAEFFAEHRRFAQQFEAPLRASWPAHTNTPDAHKRIKIGYVSPDFRAHSVAYFFEPILAHHDRTQVEVFCYYNYVQHDNVTDRIQAAADHWLVCNTLSDDQLAERIRADGIDILVDLAGHTAHNRLLVFARKPAPVQVTAIGYPATTGLTAMDYRLTDHRAEPPGLAERYYSEQLWRLPGMHSVYRPCARTPARRNAPELSVQPTPALVNHYITFGSLNNVAKLTAPVIALWSKILHALPDAKLLLEAPGLDETAMRAEFTAKFADHAIGAERLILLGRKPEQQYVLYHRIDIALDPFPCAGGTTSCDAVWMGVPLITLAGDTFAGRMGVTIAHSIGHPEWVADNTDEYQRKAIDLACDVQRLNAIRLRLRQQVEASPMMDEIGYTRGLETAYRQMWKIWCTQSADSSRDQNRV